MICYNITESFEYEESDDSPNYKSPYSPSNFRESVEIDDEEGKCNCFLI